MHIHKHLLGITRVFKHHTLSNIQQEFENIAHTIPYNTIQYKNITITIKRLDQIHPAISGNKFFKLKYNMIQAKHEGYSGVLSFGGAYSNHIAATAYAAHYFGFNSIGIIRGEELQHKTLNPTLALAEQLGMSFSFMSRDAYKLRNQPDFLQQLQARYPNYYIIPEGGTNQLAISGCKEILTPSDLHNYQTICCAVGTAGTISGLIESSSHTQHIWGFSALKGDFLKQDIQKYTSKTNWILLDDYCCGGYAKTPPELIEFIRSFEKEYGIPLEQIYTGKMLMGIFDLIDQKKLTNSSRILVIHSGGLQGRSSFI